MRTKPILAAIGTLERLSLEVSMEDASALNAAILVLKAKVDQNAQEEPSQKTPARRSDQAGDESTPPCLKCGGRTAMQDGYLCGIMGEEPQIFCVNGCDDKSGLNDA